jgi:hypothetical protein
MAQPPQMHGAFPQPVDPRNLKKQQAVSALVKKANKYRKRKRSKLEYLESVDENEVKQRYLNDGKPRDLRFANKVQGAECRSCISRNVSIY